MGIFKQQQQQLRHLLMLLKLLLMEFCLPIMNNAKMVPLIMLTMLPTIEMIVIPEQIMEGMEKWYNRSQTS